MVLLFTSLQYYNTRHYLTYNSNTQVPKYYHRPCLKFIPTPRQPNQNSTASFACFKKYFHTKVFVSGRHLISYEIFDPKLHVESEWCPKLWDIPDEIHNRTNAFRWQVLHLLKKKRPRPRNLLPFQLRALYTLALRTNVVVVNCDKNLGPAIIDTSTYINRTFKDHC